MLPSPRLLLDGLSDWRFGLTLGVLVLSLAATGAILGSQAAFWVLIIVALLLMLPAYVVYWKQLRRPRG